MSCTKSFSLGPAAGPEQPMDSACYNPVDGFIYAVRGGRIFRCSATTGAVVSQADYQQLAFGPATICFDTVSNKMYAASMMTPHYDVAAFGADRNFYRINYATTPPSVAQTFNFKTLFGLPLGNAALESGIMTMRPLNGTIYALAFSATVPPSLYVLRFDGNDPITNLNANIGYYNYPSFAVATIGGQDFMFFARQDFNYIASYGWSGAGYNTNAFTAARGYYATEYAPVQNKVFVTRELQFVDVYDNAVSPNYLATINTLRSAFNGVNIKYNTVDQLLYIAGGLDNTVIALNPADNSFSVKSGFDLPWDIVFTPTKKFAVQQGSVGLKEII